MNNEYEIKITLEIVFFIVSFKNYYEDLLRHRDRELQQLKTRFESLKSERDNDVRLMENIIIELQLELFVNKNSEIGKKEEFVLVFRRTARDEAEFKRKKSQTSRPTTPSKSLFNFANRIINSPTTPTNDRNSNDETATDT